MADERPQYQYGTGTIGGQQFHWGSGTPGKYWSIPYGDYPVTPNAPTGAWAHQAGAIPIANNVIPDPQLGRNRIGIMIHSGSAPDLDTLYTQGCFKVAPQEWPGVRAEILKEASNGPLYLHVQPGGVAAFTNTKTFSQAGDQTPAANANTAANTAAAPSANSSGPQSPPPQGTTLNSNNVIDTLSRNIAGIESGGQKNPYDALNPDTHAIGKYQVMPSNVPGWTQAATGQSMTPDEFKASPSAQEAVFRDQMQRNLQLYGPKDAASIWFTGKPYNVAGGAATDANKTTNASYVARATAGLDDSGTFQPSQAPGPMDPSAQAGGPGAPLGTPGSTVNPPIPTTPGTTINSTPAVAGVPTSQWGQVGQNLKKTLGLPEDGSQDQGQQDVKPSPMIGPTPQAHNVSPLLGSPQTYAQRMAGVNQPMTWGSAPPGQMPGAGYGVQAQPSVYGTSLMSNLGRSLDPQWMNSWGT